MILVTGASGKLGAYVVRELAAEGRRVAAWSGRREGTVCGVPLQRVDLTDPKAVRKAYRAIEPAAVIHCAALSAVGDCYREPELADRINHRATALLGELSERLVYISTDLVFEGERAPYGEGDEPSPLSVYGRSKLAGEEALFDKRGASVVRVSLLYGPALFGDGGFFQHQVESLRGGREVGLFEDEWRTPLALDEAARGIVRTLDYNVRGVLHLGGSERLSRYSMGLGLAEAFGFPAQLVEPVKQASIETPEPRPSDVSLLSDRAKRVLGWRPSSYADGLKRLIGTTPCSFASGSG